MSSMIRSTRVKSLTSVAARDIPKTKEEIKSKLPFLTSTEIRRHKIPYNDAVINELREEGSHEAAEYFEFLFDLEEQTRRVAGPDTVVWNKPRLRDNEELVDRLRKVFTIFCRRTNAMNNFLSTSGFENDVPNRDGSVRSKSGLGMVVGSRQPVSHCSVDSQRDQRERQASRLRLEILNDAKTALEHVRTAQRDSREKPWNASKILGFKQENLFRECCTLLQKVLLTIARDVRDSEVELSVNSCRVALSAACESGHEESVAQAHHELGKSEIAAGNVKEAIKHFSRGLAILERIPDPLGICNAHSEMALAHKTTGDHDKVLEHLEKFKDSAEKFNLQDKLAEAHWLAGEYHLSQDNPKEATPNLEMSLSLYSRIGEMKKASRVRCLIGVSRGQEMMDVYKALIIRSIKGDVQATLNLCRWRDRGEAFDKISIHEKDSFCPYFKRKPQRMQKTKDFYHENDDDVHVILTVFLEWLAEERYTAGKMYNTKISRLLV
ncbi:hypothetical protein TSAR_013594 [Trichomalopsis sarcophagae]|uniref:Tetratricopeptide repeat protein 29 n=1 Tax=Trichomalopsis sarcophagae TaxID=543379 RepID=A0A232FAN3_9HYME|nr:hypothetical protein TSAR_013594 [Trichomalopsis sarcophagae]